MLGGPGTFSLILILSVCSQCIHGGSKNQPKMRGRDGEITLEAAQDKNITIRLQGESAFMVNELDMLDSLEKRSAKKPQPVEVNFDSLSFRVQRLQRSFRRLIARIRILENRNNTLQTTRLRDLLSRMGALNQRYNRIIGNLTDKCVSNPCKNGGDCYSLFADFHCDCPDAWTGKTCETDVDECDTLKGSDLGCQNNAVCVNSDGAYRCVCATGYSGTHCRERKSDCEKSAPGELCGKGTCIPASNELGYKCICNAGWKTDNISAPCTVDVNECVEAHVMCHTSCINLPGTFTCGPCPTGYTGDGIKCQDINECAVNNGGCSLMPKVQCINTEGSHQCGKCPPGWTGNGQLCSQVETNSCGPDNICHPQAICQYISNIQVCQCPAGMTGTGYGPGGCTSISVDPCADHQCKNGGTCVSRGTRHSCICPSGYRQPFCLTRSLCVQRPCFNGGMCVDDDSSSGFHCVCSRGSSGPLCQQKQLSCGSVLRDRSGELTYPANGAVYEAGRTCAWGIRTDFNLTLNVTFTRFDLEEHPECGKDWLQINDGRSLATPLIGRFCGNKLPNDGNILSSHNTLLLWFRSDNTTNLSGFSLKWNSVAPVCGGHQQLGDEAQGIIRSPGYPGMSPRGRDCEWSLEAPFGKRILLRFYEVEMNTKANCSRSKLIIYDSDQVLESICAKGTPAPIYTSSNVAKIHLHTSIFHEESLFQAHYEVVAGSPGCGGVHSEAVGKFQLTTDMKNCNFLIQLPPGTRISANFTKEEYHFGNPSIKVFDGKTDDDPVLSDFADDTWSAQLLSSGNFMLIAMAMNQSPMNRAGSVIYDVSYKLVCGEELRDPNGGTFTSPNYPQPYFSGLHCKYVIIGPLNSIVRLNITDYDISVYEDICNDDTDFIDIYYDVKESVKSYCKDAPLVIVSSKNYLRIDFHSNANPQRRRGISVSYSFEEIGCGGVLRDREGSFSASESDTQCEWILEAPPTEMIALDLDYARVGTNCAPGESDVQIFVNGTDAEAQLVQSLCGGEKQVRTVLFSNLVTVFLRPLPSGLNTGVSYGIKANYTFTTRSSKCGGNFTDLSGSIQSPGFPGIYPNSVNCTWVIHAPLGHKIELVPRTFSLEPSSRQCYSDFLEIRNGMSEMSPMIGRFCGNTILPLIPSFTNHLYLHFHSDSSVAASGFDILFRQTSNGCGGSLTSHSGSIASPHYPEISGAPIQCDWKITVSRGSSIAVQILRLSPTAEFCTNNVLGVYDGTDTLAKRLTMNCSQTDPNIFLTSTGNTITVRYTLLENTTADGQQFYLNYTTNCRQTLTALEGVIESPNFPGRYPNNLRCEWTIVGRQADKIVLTFSHFQLERGDLSCQHDELEVIDMKGEEVLQKQRVCNPLETGDVLTSDGNKVVVKFWTDYSNSGNGFRLEFKRNGCGGIETRPRGTLTTPNAPYSVDMDCEWLIETTPGLLIILDISDMQMETGTADCAANGLIIKNGKDDEHSLLQECQVQQHRLTVTSQATTMYIHFYSDSKRSRKFMKAFYWTKPAQCGGVFRSHSGTIMSPNYPNNYTENSMCEWMITTEGAFSLRLQFITIDIPVAENCSRGVVEVYEGRKFDESSKLVKRLCESSKDVTLMVTGNMAHVILNSVGGPPGKGFLMKYQKQCGSPLIQSSGLLKSYIQDQPCTWLYRSNDTETKLTITILKLECHCDGLKADDCRLSRGLRIYKDRLDQSFCENPPSEVTLTGTNRLTVDFAVSFVASYSIGVASCGGVLSSLRGVITSPYYPSVYPMNTECIWTVEATPGNNIALSIDDINLNPTERCNRDYVEMREKGPDGNLLGAFCSNDSISQSYTAYEKLWIKFHSSDASIGVNSGGFKISWTYAQLNELTGFKGRIEPPSPAMARFEPESFRWRISVPRDNVIWLAFKEYNGGLQVFDGFDENALMIDIQLSPWEVTSSSNVVLIKTDNKILEHFRLDWEAQSKTVTKQNTTISKCNETLIVGVSGVVDLSSPGYPDGYETGLKCEWTVKADRPTRHAVLRLYDVQLESMVGCAADYLQIFTSNNLMDWHEELRICEGPPKSVEPFQVIPGTPHLKVKFVTDMSINVTGFKSALFSQCGGNLTDPVGRILGSDVFDDVAGGNCTLQVQVRPGRRIKFTFEFPPRAVVNSSGTCNSYAIIREGITGDGPILPPGRICSSNDFNGTVLTNTNYATIRFVTSSLHGNPFLTHGMKMWNVTYREYSVCGGEVRLTPYSRSVNFTSPNYPHVPNAHTECVWLVVAPPGESVRAEFVDQFSMNARHCDSEFVELRDGSTALARLLGKHCRRPATIRSSGNVLYVRYLTDIGEPRNGFKVNVSISTCGGTFTQFNNILTSPNYPAPGGYPSNSVCDYVLKVYTFSRLNLTFLDVHLPFDSNNLNESDRIVVYQVTDPASEEMGEELAVIYGNTTVMPVLLVDNNEVRFRFYTFKANHLYRGFKLKYDRMFGFCYRDVSGESGVLTLYLPSNQRLYERCRWKITVPKGRRVEAEIKNVNTATSDAQLLAEFKILFFNDFQMTSRIIAADFNNVTALPLVRSTDNMMYVLIYGLRTDTLRGLRLTYSSLEPSNCTDDITTDSGALSLANVDHSQNFFCKSDVTLSGKETLSLNISSLEVMFQRTFPRVMVSEAARLLHPPCVQFQSRTIVDTPQTLCANFTNKNLLIPVRSGSLIVYQNENVKLRRFEATFRKHQCGGEYHAKPQLQFALPKLEDTYGRLECAWVIFAGTNKEYELTGQFDFKLPCQDEYLAVYAGSTSNNLQIAKFCNNGTFNGTRLLSAASSYVYIEYRTSAYSPQSTAEMTIKKTSVCGKSVIVDITQQFVNSDYRNNMECVWDLMAREGFFLRLEFVGRFFIEDSKDCVKDYLEVRKFDQGQWVSVGRYCGRQLPPAINTTSAQMQLIFHTDDSVTADGFTVIVAKTCDGVFNVTGTPQTIRYPYKWTAFMVRLACNYTLLTESEKYIKVKFNKMTIGYRRLCGMSQMRIRKQNAHGEMEELGPYCESGAISVVKARKYMSLSYLGLVDTGTYEFEFSLETCGGEVTTPQWIESQQNDQASGYTNNMNCVWNITAPADHNIVIQFKYLNMEMSDNCTMDYVEVFKGPLMQDAFRERKMCGDKTRNPPILFIESNRAVVAAASDYWLTKEGFMARVIFSKSCKERLTLTEANTPTRIDREQEIANGEVMFCDYRLMAPTGFRIQVDLELVDLKTNPNVTCKENCENCDYLEVVDSVRSGGLRITKVCRRLTSTLSVMSSFKDAVIRAHLEQQGTHKYKLNLRLVAVDCGGQLNFELTADSPLRITPALTKDKLYLPNVHCIWKITSDKNFDVKLENFSLQNASDVTGECVDYLQIKSLYNYRVSNKKHCGAAPSYTIKAAHIPHKTVSVEIIFHTDEAIESTGFTLTATQTPSCNTTYNGTSGLISGYFDMTCTNYITMPENRTVNVVATNMFFSTQNCSVNYIKAIDMKTNNQIFSGCTYEDFGTKIFSPTNRVRVDVKFLHQANLELYYYGSPASLPPGCGGSLDMPLGYIGSPDYMKFENATVCRWNITTVAPNRINLRFAEIHMGTKCRLNYLNIIDIDSNGVENVAEHYCNREVETNFVSKSNRVAVVTATTPDFDGTGWNLNFHNYATGESVYSYQDLEGIS